MVLPETNISSTKPKLVPLTSIRFLAAMHIFIFHIHAGHQMAAQGKPGLVFPVFDRMPRWFIEFIEHGYCATGMFFLLSGFILSYLYVDASGRFTPTLSHFYWTRWSRIYPLHVLVLLLIAPAIIPFAIAAGGLGTVLISGLLSLLLLQAWFPPYALSWNFPTWALSAVVFFYAVFPLLARWLRDMKKHTIVILLFILPFVSLAPTLIYLWLDPTGQPMSFWNEWIMRTPLLWLPHFAMGVLLSRAFGITRHETSWRRPSKPWQPSFGDAAAIAVLLVMFFDEPVHPLLLRHGMLAPLFLLITYDLAQGRGILSALLSLPILGRMGDASFSIFMLQLPMLIVGMIVSQVWRVDSLWLLVFIIAATVLLSVLSTNYFEKPVAAALRKRHSPSLAT